MPKKALINFYTIFFSLYLVINFYIFIHGYNILSGLPLLIYSLIFLICSSSFFIGRYLEKRTANFFGVLFVWIGSLWFAGMLYFFIVAVISDLLLLFNTFLSFLPDNFMLYMFYVVVCMVIITITIGYFNARNVRIKNLNIDITSPSSHKKKYNIVVASDIHLGTIIGSKRLRSLVTKINSLKPDIVLLPGDVLDEDLIPVIRQDLGEVLKVIKAPLGVFSITGNHEYIGGVNKAVDYLTEHYIKVLRDESILIDDTFHLIGREDRSINNFIGKKRKPLTELVRNLDNDKPKILMDHQPYDLDEAVKNNIDIQLSGHTHHAQLWPLNYITQKIYEVSWGYKKKENTHFYVSCGAGTWGPPVRLGNTPEIIQINLKIA